ncbi:hypothetical protein MUK42_28959 [Musa troglodytarum]|uniref:Uncharacterized protein n=1 Tax=Musa troglodytarum TaxID=320322 RepID=A0A9E7K996_9LILI|nr:hypothetical protein MUK42_28959 [Musa troglodytarum]
MASGTSTGGWNPGCHGIKHRAWALRNQGPPVRIFTMSDLEENLKQKSLSGRVGRGWNAMVHSTYGRQILGHQNLGHQVADMSQYMKKEKRKAGWGKRRKKRGDGGRGRKRKMKEEEEVMEERRGSSG